MVVKEEYMPNCMYCDSSNVRTYAWNKPRTKRRYICKDCNKSFMLSYMSKNEYRTSKYDNKFIEKALKLLKEKKRMTIVCKMTGCSSSALRRWRDQYAPELKKPRLPSKPRVLKPKTVKKRLLKINAILAVSKN